MSSSKACLNAKEVLLANNLCRNICLETQKLSKYTKQILTQSIEKLVNFISEFVVIHDV